MVENCRFEAWNYIDSSGEYSPAEIIEICSDGFIRIHGYIQARDRNTGELVVKREFDSTTTMDFLRPIKGRCMFEPGDGVIVNDSVALYIEKVEEAEIGTKLYYTYIESTQETAPKYMNQFGYQMKKIVPGFNWICLRGGEDVKFWSDPILPGLKRFLGQSEERKFWYFSDPVDKETTIKLEKILGLVDESGKTWQEILSERVGERSIAIKRDPMGKLFWVDMADPKNPKFPAWAENGKATKDLTIEELILDI